MAPFRVAVTLAEFEEAEWLASVSVWETGELELEAGRTAAVASS